MRRQRRRSLAPRWWQWQWLDCAQCQGGRPSRPCKAPAGGGRGPPFSDPVVVAALIQRNMVGRQLVRFSVRPVACSTSGRGPPWAQAKLPPFSDPVVKSREGGALRCCADSAQHDWQAAGPFFCATGGADRCVRCDEFRPALAACCRPLPAPPAAGCHPPPARPALFLACPPLPPSSCLERSGYRELFLRVCHP